MGEPTYKEEKDYKDIDAVNQSLLTTIDSGNIIEIENKIKGIYPEEDKDYFYQGDLLEDILFLHDIDFNEKYSIINEDFPSYDTKYKNFLDIYGNTLKEGMGEDSAYYIAKQVSQSKKDMSKEIEKYQVYLNSIKDGKIPIPHKMFRETSEMARGIKDLHPEMITRDSWQEVKEFEYKGIKCKLKADIILPDNTIVDIKTTKEYPDNFMSSYYRFRYDIQAAFYMTGLESSNFYFLVSSKTMRHVPALYKAPENIEKIFKGYRTKKGKELRGIDELLDMYGFYKEQIKVQGTITTPYSMRNTNIFYIERYEEEKDN